MCLPCPSNQWCPFYDTVAPVPCHGGGETNGGGMSTPLACSCPTRTYGVQCLPCADNVDCSAPLAVQPTLVASLLIGLGPLTGADSLMQECIAAASLLSRPVFFVDAVAVPPSMLAVVASTASPGGGTGSTTTMTMRAWGWVFVSEPAQQEKGAWDTAQACLVAHGFASVSVADLGQPRVAVGIKRAILCAGVAQEWNGLDGSMSGCSCAAGHELVVTASWGAQCFPCLNGTVRARRSPVAACIACDGRLNEVAPSMGMEACVCASGYARHTGACVVETGGGGVVPEPSIVTMGSLAVIGVGAAVGCALLTFGLAAAVLL